MTDVFHHNDGGALVRDGQPEPTREILINRVAKAQVRQAAAAAAENEAQFESAAADRQLVEAQRELTRFEGKEIAAAIEALQV